MGAPILGGLGRLGAFAERVRQGTLTERNDVVFLWAECLHVSLSNAARPVARVALVWLALPGRGRHRVDKVRRGNMHTERIEPATP